MTLLVCPWLVSPLDCLVSELSSLAYFVLWHQSSEEQSGGVSLGSSAGCGQLSAGSDVSQWPGMLWDSQLGLHSFLHG